MIYFLGQRLHPEHPYDSPKVQIILKAQRVFGFSNHDGDHDAGDQSGISRRVSKRCSLEVGTRLVSPFRGLPKRFTPLTALTPVLSCF